MGNRFDIHTITGPHRVVYWDGGTLRLDNGGHATMGKPDKAAKENKGQQGRENAQAHGGNAYGPGGNPDKLKEAEDALLSDDEDEGLTEPPPSEEPVVPAQ